MFYEANSCTKLKNSAVLNRDRVIEGGDWGEREGEDQIEADRWGGREGKREGVR